MEKWFRKNRNRRITPAYRRRCRWIWRRIDKTEAWYDFIHPGERNPNMDINHFTRSDSREPGTWKPTSTGGAILVCPVCKQTVIVGGGVTSHTIQDGRINPSVICTRSGCTYHEFVTLG